VWSFLTSKIIFFCIFHLIQYKKSKQYQTKNFLSITTIAPKFGVGNAVFFVLVGQLVSAAVIDHLALFGSTGSPLTSIRALGIAVMALGVWITQQG
jgi:hypothetical protein